MRMKIEVENMIEGNRYRLEPNQNYRNGAELVWYEIEVLEMFESNVYFRVLRSNAEHTEEKAYTFPFVSQIFRVRDVIPLNKFRRMENMKRDLKQLEEREARTHREEQPRPLNTYEMSTSFKKVLIDIALMDNDEEWFKELTGASQVG